MTISEFLLERIAEDEAMAEAAIQPGELYPWGDESLRSMAPEDVPVGVDEYLGGTWGKHFANWSPLRVLAECKAKRAIVERCARPSILVAQDVEHEWSLLTLASVYSDHPDYRDEWRL